MANEDYWKTTYSGIGIEESPNASVNYSAPEPEPNDGKGDVWKLVINDMIDRRSSGINKYGKPLQAHNGRNSLVDAYQEILDAAVYLRQKIQEEESVLVYTFKGIDDGWESMKNEVVRLTDKKEKK